MSVADADPLPGRTSFALLGANRPFRLLWTARLVSFLGDSLGLVALILYVADRAGTGAAVGLLLLAGDFAPTLVGPFAGALADRLPRRRVMVTCEALQSVAVFAIVLSTPSLPVLLPLVAVRAMLSTTFQPAARSAVPELVGDTDLERGNALLGFGTWGLDAAGPLLAALLVPVLHVRGLLLVDALSFLAAIPFLLRLPALGPVPRPDAVPSLARDVAAGLRFVWEDRFVRVLVLGFAAIVLVGAVDDVAIVLLAKGALHGGERLASVLYAGAGIGMLAGFLLLARARPLTARVALLCGFVLTNSASSFTGATRIAYVALLAQVVRGLGISLVEVGHNVAIARGVPPALHGRVFANLYAALGVAAGIAYAVGGPLVDATSPRAVLVGSGLLGLAVTGVMGLRLPGTPPPPR